MCPRETLVLNAKPVTYCKKSARPFIAGIFGVFHAKHT